MNLGDICSSKYLLVALEEGLGQTVKKLSGQDTAYVLVADFGQIEKVFTDRALLRLYMESEGSDSPLEDCVSRMSFKILSADLPVEQIPEMEEGTLVIAFKNENPVGVLHYTKAIQELLSANKTFDLSIEGFQQVFENIEEEIVVSTGEGRISYLNPKAEYLIGLPARELVGMSLEELVEKKIFYPSAALEVLKTRKKVDMQTTLKDGEERLSTAIPIFDQSGGIKYTVCTSKNVGEILRLNQQLLSKKAKLKQKDEEIERMQKKEFEQMNFYFDSPEMYKVMRSIRRTAPLDMTVLIQGETGVGKGIIAKSIHYLSNRKHQPFVKINCGLIPENLIEAELFGYEEGAFTGASKGGKVGKVEMANGGTLFLDEIGDMPLPLQIKLLDFIQDATFVRVGGVKPQKADVRIISATNRDLDKMMQEGSFRQDLFYRLNVFNLTIPPLRERTGDIPELIEFFLKKFNSKYGLNKKLAPDLIYELYQYSWPGNVRELEHTLERLIVMSEGDEINSETLHEALNNAQKPSLNIVCNGIMPYKEAKNMLEKILVQRAYETCGSTYKAAEALGIDQSTVAKLLKKYRVEN